MDPVSALIGYLEGVDKAPVYAILPLKNPKDSLNNADTNDTDFVILRDETAWCGKYLYVTGTSAGFLEREEGVLLEQEVHSKGKLEEKIPINGFVPQYCSSVHIIKPPPPPADAITSIPSAPFFVDLYITLRCNLGCIHCGYSCGPQSADRELSTEQWKNIMDILDRVGVFQIRIQGGEPLLRPDMADILRYAATKHFTTWLFTNGTLITEEIAKLLATSYKKIKVSISLDGGTPSTHDFFRGQVGTFNRVMRSLELLRNYSDKIAVILNVVLHRYNCSVEEIEKIMQIALDRGASAVSFVTLNYVGRALEREDIRLNPEETRIITRKIIEIGKFYAEKGLGIQIQQKAPYIDPFLSDYLVSKYINFSSIPKNLIDLYSKRIVCAAGIVRACVDPKGDLYPCEVCLVDREKCSQFKAGNLINNDFYEIWYKSWKFLREGIKKEELLECSSCKYRENCRMNICRLYPLVSGFDILSAPPECHWYYLK
ncbi:MAG: radical SAM protein, partial [Thaumarchaeota archaeon]|nr:radical SAM protein [Candidatus Geocrenenecus arthurdayi]